MKMNLMTSRHGHKAYDVDTLDTVSIEDAMKRFDILTGRGDLPAKEEVTRLLGDDVSDGTRPVHRAHAAFAKDADGNKRQIREFDQTAEEILFIPALVGG